MANHESSEWEWKGKQFTCKPGQLITSLKSIKKVAGRGITINMIRKALKKFEKYEFCTNEGTMTGRLITIVNWEQYQYREKKEQREAQSRHKAGTSNKNVSFVFSFYCSLFKGVYEPRRLTEIIKSKIRSRLKEYSIDEIKEALTNMRKNKFLCGKNDSGKVYAKPEYCFRNEGKIEEWLSKNLKPGKKIYQPGDKINWEDQ